MVDSAGPGVRAAPAPFQVIVCANGRRFLVGLGNGDGRRILVDLGICKDGVMSRPYI